MDNLEKFKSKCILIPHQQSGRTTKDAAKALNENKSIIIKSLLLKSKKEFFAVIISGDKKIDIVKLKKHFNVGKISFASPEEIKNLTGFQIGGVPPYAFYEKCKVVIDVNLMHKDYVVGAGGNEFTGLKFNPMNLLLLYKDVVNIAA